MSVHLFYSRNGKSHDLLLEALEDKSNPYSSNSTITLNGRKFALIGDIEETNFLIDRIEEFSSHQNISNKMFEGRLIQLGLEKIDCPLLQTAQKIKTENQTSKSEFDGKLHEIVLEDKFSGSVLVAQKGKILHKMDYGYAASKKSDNADLVYRWCSITKTITAVAVLKLVEEGEINLDTPITEYLEEYKNSEKYPGFVNVTARELLTHTSRAPDHQDYLEKLYEKKLSAITDPQEQKNLQDPEALKKFKSDIEEDYFLNYQNPQDMAQHIGALPLKNKPSDYNNFAFTLLGLMVERKGKSYKEFVQKNIFTPAGMKTAQIATHKNNDLATAEGFILNNQNLHILTPVDDQMVRFGSGNINGSVMDLYFFDCALKEGLLLGNKMTQEMQDQRLGFDPKGLAPSEVFGKKMLAKCGSMAGLRTVYQFFPEEDLTIIILGNSDLDVCHIGEKIVKKIFNNNK